MFTVYGKVVTVIIFQSVMMAEAFNSLCDSNSSDSRSLGISVNSQRSDFGKWTDSFYARAEHSNTLSNISVDVLHNITECSGRRVIQIRGIIQNSTNPDQQIEVLKVESIVFHSNHGPNVLVSNNGRTIETNPDQQTEAKKYSIVFHSKHGENVIVSNNGRTIEKKNLGKDGNGIALTNRALKNDEFFEVRLDQKGSKTSYSFGIGILNKDPEDFDIPIHMHYSKYGWMYHNNAIYNENNVRRSSYGRNLNVLPVGTKFGVMKNPSGDIHFFVNEVDQGPAIHGISDPVYGVVELWRNAEKVTILAP